jgi:hypothetical protein
VAPQAAAVVESDLRSSLGRVSLEDAVRSNRIGSTAGSSSRALRLDDLTGFDASSADANALVAAINFSLDRAKIYVPATLGHVVRMRDLVTELRAFAADFTYLCHDKLQIAKLFRRKRDHRTGLLANLQYSRNA